MQKGAAMLAKLPVIADQYVQTVNAHDAAGFNRLFADDAIVNDNGRTFQGQPAIADWGAREIFAAHVTLDVLTARETPDGATIVTIVDGTFDRTGLPDPVVIEQRFTTRNGRIAELICRLAEAPDVSSQKDN
jgi:hypothetical protein